MPALCGRRGRVCSICSISSRSARPRLQPEAAVLATIIFELPSAFVLVGFSSCLIPIALFSQKIRCYSTALFSAQNIFFLHIQRSRVTSPASLTKLKQQRPAAKVAISDLRAASYTNSSHRPLPDLFTTNYWLSSNCWWLSTRPTGAIQSIRPFRFSLLILFLPIKKFGIIINLITSF